MQLKFVWYNVGQLQHAAPSDSWACNVFVDGQPVEDKGTTYIESISHNVYDCSVEYDNKVFVNQLEYTLEDAMDTCAVLYRHICFSHLDKDTPITHEVQLDPWFINNTNFIGATV